MNATVSRVVVVDPTPANRPCKLFRLNETETEFQQKLSDLANFTKMSDTRGIVEVQGSADVVVYKWIQFLKQMDFEYS